MILGGIIEKTKFAESRFRHHHDGVRVSHSKSADAQCPPESGDVVNVGGHRDRLCWQ